MFPEEHGVRMDTRLVRPYQAAGTRTKPTVVLDLLTLVWSTRTVDPAHLGDYQAQVLVLCHEPISIAEIAGHMELPAAVTKILVSDLIEAGAVQQLAPEPYDDGPPIAVLEALLNGLHRRL